jgi:hypothetical protein
MIERLLREMKQTNPKFFLLDRKPAPRKQGGGAKKKG